MPRVIRRHPRSLALAALMGVALLVFGILWFEPHKLFLDQRVDEAPPGQSASEARAMEPSEAPSEQGRSGGSVPVSPPARTVLARGRFIGLEHPSSGRAVIVETANRKRFLRFEDFSTSNGPDLFVYLSAKAPSGSDDWYGYDRDFVELGPLKGNVGSQNYAVPGGVDLDRYGTAVVWCRRFTVGFAAAVLA